jgi:hypothetical protein
MMDESMERRVSLAVEHRIALDYAEKWGVELGPHSSVRMSRTWHRRRMAQC